MRKRMPRKTFKSWDVDKVARAAARHVFNGWRIIDSRIDWLFRYVVTIEKVIIK